MTPADLKAMFDRARANGLKGSGLHVALLLHASGPQRPKELAIDSGLSNAGLTQTVDGFQLKGWVTREPDPEDKRGCLVTPTAAGRKLFTKVFTP